MNSRLLVLPLLLLAACSFEVPGVGAGQPGTPGDPLPTPSDPTTPLIPSTPPTDVDAGAADSAPALPNIGAACDPQHPCVGGARCLEVLGKGPMGISFPGGSCSLDCKSTPCPTGATCVAFDKEQWCMPSCQGQGGQGQGGCRTGYSCCDQSPQDACVPSPACH